MPDQKLAAPVVSSEGKALPLSDKPKKTIVAPVTIHQPVEGHIPYKFDGNGGIIEGHYKVAELPPGSEVTMEASEADAILRRFPEARVVDHPGEGKTPAIVNERNENLPVKVEVPSAVPAATVTK